MLTARRLLRGYRCRQPRGGAQDGHHAERRVWRPEQLRGPARGAAVSVPSALSPDKFNPAIDLSGVAPARRKGGGPPPLLDAQHMSKRFGSLVALDNVSFKLQPGSFHALLGENGAGKSTLVKCIMGFYQADSGKVV